MCELRIMADKYSALLPPHGHQHERQYWMKVVKDELRVSN